MKKVCILYTSAGAGHRSVANSLKAELAQMKDIHVETVDFSKEYKLPVFSGSEKIYKFALKFFPEFYGLIVWFINLKPITGLTQYLYYLQAKRYFPTFLKDHPADVYFSTCYFDNSLFRFLKLQSPKSRLVMFVTDIVFPLRIWFANSADLTLIPTQELYEQGKKYFQHYNDKVRVLGLPVARIFFDHPPLSALKKALGLNSAKTILVFGGGEGMDQVADIAVALDTTHTNINICVLCGKDSAQKARLSSRKFRNNAQILGWTDKFAEYLLASDLIISKAGATLVWEVMTAGKQMIIFDYIRGQESGNVEFAQKYAGSYYETDTRKIAELAVKLLSAKNPVSIQHAYRANFTEKIAKLISEL